MSNTEVLTSSFNIGHSVFDIFCRRRVSHRGPCAALHTGAASLHHSISGVQCSILPHPIQAFTINLNNIAFYNIY